MFRVVNAAQFLQCQGYDIHYAVFSSLLVPPEVAAAHGITRSKNRMVTNIAVRRDGHSVEATIGGTSRNLLGQTHRLEFSRITERDAVYYLATQVVRPAGTLKFEIDVLTPGTGSPCKIDYVYRYQPSG